jgi:hypothetical protein
MDFGNRRAPRLRPALQVQDLGPKKTNAPGIDGVSAIPEAPRAREAVQFVVAPEFCA